MSDANGSRPDLEGAVRAVGGKLGAAIQDVVASLDGHDLGPQRFGTRVGVDKVLASRILKALRCESVIDQLHHMPGPVPLRRFLRSSKRKTDLAEDRFRDAMVAVDEFEALLTDRIGDRSALTTLLTAWSDEVRAEFELRRKQAAWRAMSELLGISVELSISTAVLSPAAESGRVDMTWVMGQFGLRRLRPNVRVMTSTRKVWQEGKPRAPLTLGGSPLDDLIGDQLDEFCERPTGKLLVEHHGDLLQYTLDGNDYGPTSAIDLLVSEVNPAELPTKAPAGSGRRPWLSKHAIIPSKMFVFDVLIHKDIYPGGSPELVILGPGCGRENNPNEPSHLQHKLDLLEELIEVSPSPEGLSLAGFERYPDAIAHVLGKLDVDANDLRAYRVAIHYPPCGIHVTQVFSSPDGP